MIIFVTLFVAVINCNVPIESSMAPKEIIVLQLIVIIVYYTDYNCNIFCKIQLFGVFLKSFA